MKPSRILVVDDTPRNLRLLADLLAARGHDVATAGSGPEALEHIRRDPPDLVLLDVVMPGMSGYDVCRAIREDPATAILPVILVTAIETSAERVRGLDAGADDFLAKPIDEPELLARVRSLLRIKHLHDTVEDQARQLAAWADTLEQRVVEQVAQLERLAALKRFLPPQVAERVLSEGPDEALASHRREIAALFVELRGFTAFAETSAPEEVMAVLQEHHAELGALVTEHQGTVERFTGDGMMVLFNAPVPQPDAAVRAVQLAIAMREASDELASRWEKRGFALRPGFGVAEGYATLGAIGTADRSSYAATGIVTDTAIALCRAAAPGEILIAGRVRAAAEGVVAIEAAGEVDAGGLLRPVRAFRVLRRHRQPTAQSGDDRERGDGARIFRQEGEYWTIAFHEASFRLKDSKGLRYLAQLLRHPEREFHALDLVALARTDVDAAETAVDPDIAVAGDLGDGGAVLDAHAKSAYRKRLAELRTDLAEAESFGDAERAGRIRGEIEFLSQQLASAVGLGGRDRRIAGAAERARVNVTRAISDGVKRIREHSVRLARHLEASVRTGTFCSYRPPETEEPAWEA